MLLENPEDILFLTPDMMKRAVHSDQIDRLIDSELYVGDHCGLNIESERFSLGSNGRGKAARKIPGACTNIDDDIARAQL